MGKRPLKALYAASRPAQRTRSTSSFRPPSDVLPTVRMRAKRRLGDGEGRRPTAAATTTTTSTAAAAAEGTSTRLFAAQSVKELVRDRKEVDDYGDRGGGGEEEEEERGALGVPVTAVVDPMMPGRVSPPPRKPGAKWPGFLVNRSVNIRKVSGILATFSESHSGAGESAKILSWIRNNQGWAKAWSLGCVNSHPRPEGQEAGFTQP